MRTSFVILSLLSIVFAATTTKNTGSNSEVAYDSSFWDDFDSEKPYEHNFDKAPDLVNITNIEWWFNMTHHFLEGFGRGLYKNDSM
jgi:hypothetical protein